MGFVLGVMRKLLLQLNVTISLLVCSVFYDSSNSGRTDASGVLVGKENNMWLTIYLLVNLLTLFISFVMVLVSYLETTESEQPSSHFREYEG